ncbi:hypothetical protein BZG02_13575 [Labilibaculum filiforme]|uniref:DUF3289 family protein n=1 Tax=Labilibaculum filiforme TaxID=1940526 RepID=A0A2N3HV67_9BACT|nr:DUF3289 family protein [Labilibaculum filiforme]PKQ61965.1 hypothetical protein BZG02_13575 [Labilibaculum filiforme]
MSDNTIQMVEKENPPRKKEEFSKLTITVNINGEPKNDKTCKSASLKMPKPLVKKVEGPFNEQGKLVKEMIEGQEYIFKATEFQKSTLTPIKHIWWAEKIDDGDIVDLEYKRDENPYLDEEKVLCFKYKVKKAEKIRIYAYVASPAEKVSVEVPVISFPFYLDRYKKAGFNEKGTAIANDLCYGDGIHLDTGHSIYSIEEIKSLSSLFSIQLKSTEKSLWVDFNSMVKTVFSVGEMEVVAGGMINHFRRNTGEEYSNSILTKHIIEHPSFHRFCTSMEDLIKERVNKNSSINDIRFSENNESKTNDPRYYDAPYGHPRFNTLKDTFNGGLTICMNDTWAYEVIITEAQINGGSLHVKYKVELYDHFGLDKPDMEKVYKFGAGFRAWFVLQHVRNYKPFITKVSFEKSIVVEL